MRLFHVKGTFKWAVDFAEGKGFVLSKMILHVYAQNEERARTLVKEAFKPPRFTEITITAVEDHGEVKKGFQPKKETTMLAYEEELKQGLLP